VDLIEKGPQMSQCINSKITLLTELLSTKGSRFCLARGQTVQTCSGLTEIARTDLSKRKSLE
jgi:hypothetical protein